MHAANGRERDQKETPKKDQKETPPRIKKKNSFPRRPYSSNRVKTVDFGTTYVNIRPTVYLYRFHFEI